MKNKINFTLVEIVMAIAIFAISITGVLSLISTSLNISSNTTGKNYSSITANIFIENIRSLVNSEVDDKEYWKGFIQEDEAHLPDGAKIIPLKENLLDDTGFNDDWYEEDNELSMNFNNLSICPNKNKPGIYKITLKTEVGQDEANNAILATDFEGVCRVWKSPISMSFYNGDEIEDGEDSNYEIFTRLNIEITWPIQKEYSTRYSKVYFFDVQRGEL